MEKTCRNGNDNKRNNWPDAFRGNKCSTVFYLPRRCAGKLISSKVSSHDKHFIVMPHSGHVTMKWEGGAATLPTLKGGRTNVRKARLLTGKIREDHVF